MSKRDYYEILGLERGADEQAIRSAFRKKAAEFHPDRHPNASPEEKKRFEEKFKELGEAYEVLSDKEKRAAYDRFGHAATAGAGGRGGGAGANPFEGFGGFGSIFGDVMEDMFSGGGGAGGRARQGSDLRADVEISFEEAAFGKEIQLPINSLVTCATCDGSGAKKGSRPSTCPRCHGQGRVQISQGFFNMVTACPDCGGTGQIIKELCPDCRGQGRVRQSHNVSVQIPAGIDNGIQIRKRGEGEAGLHGAPPGDLYVVVSVRPHPIFQREGADVHCELPISVSQAALGAEVEVPTLEGGTRIKIPAGTQSGKSFRLKNKGVAELNGRGRGDQIVTVFVETPTHLSARQKELLEEFSKISSAESNPRSKGFMEKAKQFFT